MRITVVTPSRNQVRFIRRTIESVLRQEGDFELEYMVLDGLSTDGTLQILESYASEIIWESAADQGQTDAINKGMKRATGDVVGWLNSDDTLTPGALARVAAAFRERPALEWVHGRCVIIDESDCVIRRAISVYKDFCCKRYSYSALLTENFVSQMTVFWRREVMEQIGYLDTSLKLAFDYDYWLRLAQRSNPLYIRQPQAMFRWYRTSKSGANFVRQFDEDYAVMRRYAPDRHRWLYMIKRFKTARILAAYGLMAILQSGRKRSCACW
jgi:glycosyltransferase involved in cell wall biosynthesis